MGIPDLILSAVACYVISLLAIAIHELGHFVAAILCRVPVLRVNIAAGKKKIEFRVAKIQFRLGLNPLKGGAVIVPFAPIVQSVDEGDPHEIGELLSARPEITPEVVKGLNTAHISSLLITLAGPLLHGGLCLVSLRVLNSYDLDFLGLPGIKFGLFVWFGVAIVNLLPFTIRKVPMDGLYVVIQLTFILFRLFGRKLEYSQTKLWVSWIMWPFGIYGLYYFFGQKLVKDGWDFIVGLLN